MLSCKDVADRASAMIDGDLSTLEALQMRLHLAMCKGCSAFIGQMRVVKDIADRAVASGGADPADDARITEILCRHRDRTQSGT